MDKTALNSGGQLRKKPFPTPMLGATLIGEEESNELNDVVSEKSPFRHYGPGSPCKVATLERLFGKYFGRRFALAVSSGSAALCCAVAALGLGPGDEVILSAFNWYSDYCALVNLGVLPVFAGVDEGLNLDPVDFEKKITPRTKAVIAVHFQGGSARMDEITLIAKKNGLKIIEDCAQAMGGFYKDTRLGTFGDVSILSFQVNKMITCGEGGAVLTDNEEYFARMVRYHDLGQLRSYFAEQLNDKSLIDDENGFAGLQFRMSELQGAFLLAQFRKLDSILDKCRKLHKKVRDYFKGNIHFKIRYIDGDCGIALFLFFKTIEEAGKFRKYLEAEGVNTSTVSACSNLLEKYPIKSCKLVHDLLPPFGKGFNGEHTRYDLENCRLSINEMISRNVTISIGPQFTDGDISDLISIIEKIDENLYG